MLTLAARPGRAFFPPTSASGQHCCAARLTHVQLAQFHTNGTAKPPFEGTLVRRLRLDGSGDSMHAFASTADGTLSFVVPHGGTLLHPAVGVKGSKLAAQGAAAVMLGVVGTPLAAIAAFVDPGLNKSADCQALLADTKAMGAPVRTAAGPHKKVAPQR